MLTQFQNSLLEAEVSALREQARIYAGALGQSAVIVSRHDVTLEPNLARPLLLRLTEPSPSAHARLFAPDGQIVADSRVEQAGRHGNTASPPVPPRRRRMSIPAVSPSVNMGERLYAGFWHNCPPCRVSGS